MHLEKQDFCDKISNKKKLGIARQRQVGENTMKIFKRILPVAAIAVAVAGIAVVTQIVGAEENDNSVIPSKVYVGDIAVGGMTPEEAQAAVRAAVEEQMGAEFTLSAGENHVTVSARELGVEWANTNVVEEAVNIGKTGNLIQRYKDMKDLEKTDKIYDISYSIDHDKTVEWLNEHVNELNRESENNSLKRENGQFIFVEGHEGIAVDVEVSADNIAAYFEESWNGEDGNISLTANVVEPEGSREQLEKIQDVLGAYSTDFSDSSAGRVANVLNATSLIDGTVLFPGEEFSVYDSIGPLDASNGYELAGAYENGTTVESYGGGVCQVSTTLYNAVIRAELEITERFAHSMLVSYVSPSMDAAIAGTYKNLKFKNTLDTPVYIEGYVEGRILHFNIFGEETRPANRTVDFESETVSEDDPVVKFVATAEPIGAIHQTQSPHIGKSAKLWKIIRIDGVEQSREEFNSSKYNSSPRIYSVGTASANPDAVNAINAAIATQDEATIRAAAAEWNDAAIAEREQQQPPEEEQPPEDDSEKKDGSDKKGKSDKKNNSDKKDNSDKNDNSDKKSGDDESGEDDKPEEDTPEE